MRAWPLVVGLAACGAHSAPSQPDGPGTAGSDAGIDAPAGPTWQPLISRNYAVDNNNPEIYVCRREKVTQDMWISGFRSELPAGTLRVWLTIDPSTSTATGNITPCDGTVGVQYGQLLFADTHGPNQYNTVLFPAGDAVHIPAGSYIVLNASVYEAQSNVPNTGTLNIDVATVPEGEVQHELQATLLGTNTINLPSDGMTHVATGSCTAGTQDYHVLAMWPHMHTLGTHSHVTIFHPSTNANDVLVDQPFQFANQPTDVISERTLAVNDQLNLVCSYVVPAATCNYNSQAKYCPPPGACGTDNLCHVGQSDSLGGEACFTAVYMWPPPNAALGCMSGNGPI